MQQQQEEEKNININNTINMQEEMEITDDMLQTAIIDFVHEYKKNEVKKSENDFLLIKLKSEKTKIANWLSIWMIKNNMVCAQFNLNEKFYYLRISHSKMQSKFNINSFKYIFKKLLKDKSFFTQNLVKYNKQIKGLEEKITIKYFLLRLIYNIYREFSNKLKTYFEISNHKITNIPDLITLLNDEKSNNKKSINYHMDDTNNNEIVNNNDEEEELSGASEPLKKIIMEESKKFDMLENNNNSSDDDNIKKQQHKKITNKQEFTIINYFNNLKDYQKKTPAIIEKRSENNYLQNNKYYSTAEGIKILFKNLIDSIDAKELDNIKISDNLIRKDAEKNINNSFFDLKKLPELNEKINQWFEFDAKITMLKNEIKNIHVSKIEEDNKILKKSPTLDNSIQIIENYLKKQPSKTIKGTKTYPIILNNTHTNEKIPMIIKYTPIVRNNKFYLKVSEIPKLFEQSLNKFDETLLNKPYNPKSLIEFIYSNGKAFYRDLKLKYETQEELNKKTTINYKLFLKYDNTKSKKKNNLQNEEEEELLYEQEENNNNNLEE